jgi:hypothetical protein
MHAKALPKNVNSAFALEASSRSLSGFGSKRERRAGPVQATAALILVSALSGCGRLGLTDFSGYQQPAYEALAPSPSAAVESGDLQALPPLPDASPTVATADLPPVEPVPGPAAPVAAVAPARAVAVSRTAVLGTWRLTSNADDCQISMALTSWSGGYRASTRGCTSPDLQRISAWDLTGNQVSLKGPDGATVATLSSAGAEQFSGQTATQAPVSLTR